MAKTKKPRKPKSGLSIDEEQAILHMKPADLAVEAARETLHVEVSKKQLKEDPKISLLEDQKKKFDDALKIIPRIVTAKEELDKIKAEEMSEDHEKVTEDIKLLKTSWNKELKDRQKRLRFMMRTLKKHMETGLLKSTTDVQAPK